jgi:hypothetical protein
MIDHQRLYQEIEVAAHFILGAAVVNVRSVKTEDMLYDELRTILRNSQELQKEIEKRE